jgi:DedD protein
VEQALKQRLVGASVLVVLAVIFLPLLFDGSGMAKPTAPLSLDLPDASAENTVTITLKPKQVKAKPKAVTKPIVVKPKPAAKPVQIVTSVIEPKAPVKPTVTAKPVVKAKPIKPVIKASAKEQFVIQLGSFGQRSNAQTLRDKLINSGYKSFVESSGQGSSKVYRVRVGPESSRERAEAIRIKLQKKRET